MRSLDELKRYVAAKEVDALTPAEAFDLVHRLHAATLEILDLAGADPGELEQVVHILDSAWQEQSRR